MIRSAAPFLLIAALASCGPVPVDQAERSCLRDAQLAERPRGQIDLGLQAGSGGVSPVGRVSVEISNDYIAGRDPSDVFARCVLRRSGEPPRRPLYEQPGWRVR